MQALLRSHASDICKHFPASFLQECFRANNYPGTLDQACEKAWTSMQDVHVNARGPLTWYFQAHFQTRGCRSLIFLNKETPAETLPNLNLWLVTVTSLSFKHQTVAREVLSWPWQNLTHLDVMIQDPDAWGSVCLPETLLVLELSVKGVKNLVIELPPRLETLTFLVRTLSEEPSSIRLLNRAPKTLWKVAFHLSVQGIIQGVPGETFSSVQVAANVAFLDNQGRPFYPVHLECLMLKGLCRAWKDQGPEFEPPLELKQLSLRNWYALDPIDPKDPKSQSHLAVIIGNCKQLARMACSPTMIPLTLLNTLPLVDTFQNLGYLSLVNWNMEDKLPGSIEALYIEEIRSPDLELKGFPETLRVLCLGTKSRVTRIKLPSCLEMVLLDLMKCKGICKVKIPESCRFLFAYVSTVAKPFKLEVSRAPRYSVLTLNWARDSSLSENLINHPVFVTRPEPGNTKSSTWSTPGSPKETWPTSDQAYWLLNCYQ